MKKVLVAVTDYPRDTGEKALMFVHVRNKYYVAGGIEVTVLNFSIDYDYIYDGIEVITLETYKKRKNNFDILISHASNIRQHYLFLRKYKNNFKRFIFIYHGHEILRISKEYPLPYKYKKNSKIKSILQNIYDSLKFKIWRGFLPKLKGDAEYIFVSHWLFERFQKNIVNDFELLGGKEHIHIIHNSVGQIFENANYDLSCEKKYDFITIRSNMDDSKYGVDLVCDLAEKYPNYKFLLIGRGKFFEYRKCPSNIEWISDFLAHEQMLHYIDQSKCALLLTREDTQGVMTCECATYGIPTVTSDIDVCKEICGDCSHIYLVSNNYQKVDLDKIISNISDKINPKYERYFYKNTVKKEEDLILQK